MKIDGGCHCGYITYEAAADPEKTTICHCTDCQHLSGSAFRTVVRVAGDTFKIIAGEPTIYVKTAESGARRVQGFRPRCGTPIYSTADGDEPKLYTIRVGLYANVLRLSRRCRFGLDCNCIGSPTWVRFVAWAGSELRRLIRMYGISSAVCRFLRSRIPNALPLSNRA
jgi:hypothetical protein